MYSISQVAAPMKRDPKRHSGRKDREIELKLSNIIIIKKIK